MFLRPELVEQCAQLVQYNATQFEEPFRNLIEALCDDYRQNMIHNMCDLFPNFNQYNDDQRFIWLMSNLNCDVISEFTKYVHSCFVRRKESTLRQN